MKFSVVNKSNQDMSKLEPFVNDFIPYAQKYMKFDRAPTIQYLSDQDNAAKTLGRTAYYDPNSYTVGLYVDGRHPKDVLRSLSHELVHHTQNCRGDLSGPNVAAEEGYAQSNPHMREMEREAYETGNLCFRDWEDARRDYLQENNYFGRRNVMSTKRWKDKELNRLLMEKWGYKSEGEKEVLAEGKGMSPGRATGHPFFKSKEEGGYDPVAMDKERGGPPTDDMGALAKRVKSGEVSPDEAMAEFQAFLDKHTSQEVSVEPDEDDWPEASWEQDQSWQEEERDIEGQLKEGPKAKKKEKKDDDK